MMNNIRQWYIENYTEITWFIIGFLTWAGLNALARGDYVSAAIDFGLVALNFAFRNR